MSRKRAWPKEMVGREVIFRLERAQVEKGKPILQVENLSALQRQRGHGREGVSFTMHEGEIFGIAGVSGNGQHELAEVLAGLRKAEGGQDHAGQERYHPCLQPGKMADGYGVYPF